MTREFKIDQLHVTVDAKHSVSTQGTYCGQSASCAAANNERVLLAFSGGASTRIGCFTNSGERVWLVDVPYEFVVNMRIEGDYLIAWTWDCWDLTFSAVTGELIAEQFTK